MTKKIIPHTAPRAPHPEPAAVLRFGDIEVSLELGYLHHLSNCQGWGDRHQNNVYADADRTMGEAIQQIERAMWAATDFDAAYRRLAEQGACDSPYGTEHERVREEWFVAGRPAAEPFIRERANVGPR